MTIDHLLGGIASFPLEDQALLHEVIGRRLMEARRREIAGRPLGMRRPGRGDGGLPALVRSGLWCGYAATLDLLPPGGDGPWQSVWD